MKKYLSHHVSNRYLLGFLLLESLLFAQSLEREVNLREACRKNIAGIYLTVYDKTQSTKEFVTLYKHKEEKFDQKIQEQEAKLKKFLKSFESSVYNLSLQEDIDITRGGKKRLELLREENHGLLLKAMQEEAEAESNAAALKKQIETVFKFEVEHSRTPPSGYPFHLEYQQECPKFRFACPLSRHYADLLRKLVPDLPLSCARYADFLR